MPRPSCRAQDTAEPGLPDFLSAGAIKPARDSDAARRAMHAHVGRVFQTIRRLLEQRGEYFAAGPHGILEKFASFYERDAWT